MTYPLRLPLDAGQAPVALDYDEYGNPRTGQAATRYNWLGAKQRSSETLTGLTRMGVRLYNAATGRFLSPDPVYGGGDDRYGYPGDPVNAFDLDGKQWNWRKVLKRTATVTGFVAVGACIVATAGLCGAAAGAALVASAAWNGYQARKGEISWNPRCGQVPACPHAREPSGERPTPRIEAEGNQPAVAFGLAPTPCAVVLSDRCPGVLRTPGL